jgi:hypothetical protein
MSGIKYKHKEGHTMWISLMFVRHTEWSLVLKIKKFVSPKGWKQLKAYRRTEFTHSEKVWTDLSDADRKGFEKFYDKHVRPFNWNWILVKKDD